MPLSSEQEVPYKIIRRAGLLIDKDIDTEDFLSSEPSKEVRLFKEFLYSAEMRVLRDFDWSFLIQGAKLTGVETDKGAYEFAMPDNLLKIVEADGEYEVRDGKIYSFQEALSIGYIQSSTGDDNCIDYTKCPADFWELTAYALAYLVAPLTSNNSQGLMQAILQKYQMALVGLIQSECHHQEQEDFHKEGVYAKLHG